MSCRAYRVLSRHVTSCHVMSCHAASCRGRHVISEYSLSCHVMSLRVMSSHVTSCHSVSCRAMARPVLSRFGMSRREGQPQHIDAVTSLSHYAHSRRSHSHSSYSYRSRSHSLRPHHSHSCASAVLSTSHSFTDFVCPLASCTSASDVGLSGLFICWTQLRSLLAALWIWHANEDISLVFAAHLHLSPF